MEYELADNDIYKSSSFQLSRPSAINILSTATHLNKHCLAIYTTYYSLPETPVFVISSILLFIEISVMARSNLSAIVSRCLSSLHFGLLALACIADCAHSSADQSVIPRSIDYKVTLERYSLVPRAGKQPWFNMQWTNVWTGRVPCSSVNPDRCRTSGRHLQKTAMNLCSWMSPHNPPPPPPPGEWTTWSHLSASQGNSVGLRRYRVDGALHLYSYTQ